VLWLAAGGAACPAYLQKPPDFFKTNKRKIYLHIPLTNIFTKGKIMARKKTAEHRKMRRKT
jgi:hypothetical protein